MIYARRNRLPDTVKVNKAGGISVLSFVRHLGLPDNVEFDVTVVNEPERKQLIFTAEIENPNYAEANVPVASSVGALEN